MKKNEFIKKINETFDYNNSFDNISSKINVNYDENDIKRYSSMKKKKIITWFSSVTCALGLIALSIVLPLNQVENNSNLSSLHKDENYKGDKLVGLNTKVTNSSCESFIINKVEYKEQYLIYIGNFSIKHLNDFNLYSANIEKESEVYEKFFLEKIVSVDNQDVIFTNDEKYIDGVYSFYFKIDCNLDKYLNNNYTLNTNFFISDAEESTIFSISMNNVKLGE